MTNAVMVILYHLRGLADSVSVLGFNRIIGVFMAEDKSAKIERILYIYTQLLNGNTVKKAYLANRFNVNERSVQRDIDDIRAFLDLESNDSGMISSVIYDYKEKGYKLDSTSNLKLTNPEILAISKILLDSRAFTKREMEDLMDKLVDCCVPRQNRDLVQSLIRNEEYHYIEPRHKSIFLDKLWTIANAVVNYNYIEITYTRLKERKTVTRKLQPLAIMFSEYYFYLAAFIDDEETRKDFDVINDSFPTIYRIDRIKDYKVLDEKFHIPYASRFQEGEFRKRIQFMYGGKLRKVKFKYTGLSIEAVLDRLPTAKVLDEVEDGYIVEAEVFGDGIDMWIKSQGNNIVNL